MEYQDLDKWKDEDLVVRSGSAGPYVELIRRNTEALRESQKSSEKSSRIMIDLSLILFLVALLQLFIAVLSMDIASWLKIASCIGIGIGISYAIYDLYKERQK